MTQSRITKIDGTLKKYAIVKLVHTVKQQKYFNLGLVLNLTTFVIFDSTGKNQMRLSLILSVENHTFYK